MSKLYLASMRRSRIDRSEVTQAIGIYKTPEAARNAIDRMVVERLGYDVISTDNEGDGFIFYFVRKREATGVDVVAGKITKMEVGVTYFTQDHL